MGAQTGVAHPTHHQIMPMSTTSMCLQGYQLHQFPGQPLPELHHPWAEEILPGVQSKPPLVQLKTISLHPIICDLRFILIT